MLFAQMFHKQESPSVEGQRPAYQQFRKEESPNEHVQGGIREFQVKEFEHVLSHGDAPLLCTDIMLRNLSIHPVH